MHLQRRRRLHTISPTHRMHEHVAVRVSKDEYHVLSSGEQYRVLRDYVVVFEAVLNIRGHQHDVF